MKHGASSHKHRWREYSAWLDAKSRCYYPKNVGYKNYGGRGVKMCDLWKHSFYDFFSYMGKCPSGMSLERKNIDGNYEPENCIWADKITQANNMRNNKRITINGRTMTCAQWRRERGFKKGIIYSRIRRGWSHEDAVLKPLTRHYD